VGGDFYDPKLWVGVVGMGVVGMAVLSGVQAVREPANREVLLQQMHLSPLPDGASVVDSETRSGRGGQRATLTVQFTPQAYASYLQSLRDHDLWSWQPITFGGVETLGRPHAGTTNWHTGPHALPGLDNVLNRPWGAEADHSFCVAVREIGWRGEPEELAPCRTFDDTEGPPDLWLKGQLDDDKRQLRALISTYP